jgi:hypothetical protein
MRLLALTILIPLFPLLVQCAGSYDAKPLAVLSNPSRAQAWGPPLTTQTANGYEMAYVNPSNPKEKFTITGSKGMMPLFYYPPNIKGNGTAGEVSESQKWKFAKVNGKVVKWYQSSFPTSEKPAVFRSMGVELANQTGGRGQYRIEAEGTKNQVRTWISELRMTP